MICANCKRPIVGSDGGSESSVYSPDRAFILCEPCWLQENAEIDREGTNDLPQRVKRYADSAASP